MSDDTRPRRKVVSGPDAFFADDLKLDEAALRSPLALPPLDFLPFDELVVLLRDHVFHLAPGPGPDRVELCGLDFALAPRATLRACEDAFLAAHAPAVAAAQAAFLRALHPGPVDAAGAWVKDRTTGQIAAVALERLRPLRPVAAAARALPPLAAAHHPSAPAPSRLAAVTAAYERMLFLDGRRYELLTTREFLESWQKSFHPDLAQTLFARPTPWPAQELCEFLLAHQDRVNAKALSVLRSGLHRRHLQMRTRIAGLDLVPSRPEPAASLADDWRAALSFALKQEALEQFR